MPLLFVPGLFGSLAIRVILSGCKGKAEDDSVRPIRKHKRLRFRIPFRRRSPSVLLVLA